MFNIPNSRQRLPCIYCQKQLARPLMADYFVQVISFQFWAWIKFAHGNKWLFFWPPSRKSVSPCLCAVVNQQDMGLFHFLFINITMTTVTFQSHCCAVICLPEYAPVCIPASVCCNKKKKKGDHLDCGQSERAVGTETQKAGLNRLPEGCSVQHRRLHPTPTPDFRSPFLSLEHMHTHMHTSLQLWDPQEVVRLTDWLGPR